MTPKIMRGTEKGTVKKQLYNTGFPAERKKTT